MTKIQLKKEEIQVRKPRYNYASGNKTKVINGFVCGIERVEHSYTNIEIFTLKTINELK